jgi:hypothetical protein
MCVPDIYCAIQQTTERWRLILKTKWGRLLFQDEWSNATNEEIIPYKYVNEQDFRLNI